MEVLEICTDASLKTFESSGRVFTCSGAVCINTGEETYIVSQDSTNNRGELLGVYIGIKLAEKIYTTNIGKYSAIYLYSDSQFAIFGIRDWINNWYSTIDAEGIMYGSSGKPVKNQELFKMIITYLATKQLTIHFFNQKGHVNLNNQKHLAAANHQFKEANGFWLKPQDIYKISFYNDLVDKNSRTILNNINQDEYPIFTYSPGVEEMMIYKIPPNYRNYIK